MESGTHLTLLLLALGLVATLLLGGGSLVTGSGGGGGGGLLGRGGGDHLRLVILNREDRENVGHSG